MRPHHSLILVAALISSAQAFTVATAPIAGPGAKPLKTCLGSLGHRRSVVSQAAKLGLLRGARTGLSAERRGEDRLESADQHARDLAHDHVKERQYLFRRITVVRSLQRTRRSDVRV